MEKFKYIVVGGSPYKGHTGTTTYTSLNIVGKTNTKKELKKIIKQQYEECAGLLLAINTETLEIV